MTVMSSAIDNTATTTAAHRDTSPVWPFHLLLARIGWVFAWLYWAINDLEARAIGKRHTTTAVILTGLALIVTAVVTIAGGAL